MRNPSSRVIFEINTLLRVKTPGSGRLAMEKNLKKGIIRENALKSDNSIGGPKSDSGYREIPIPEPFKKDLKKGTPFAYVCTNASGGRHTKQSIRQMWESFVYQLNKQMGCKTRGGISLTRQRLECFKAYSEGRGVSINVARELMGHSSVSITEGYTHKSTEAFNSAAKLINSTLKSGNKPANVVKQQLTGGKRPFESLRPKNKPVSVDIEAFSY